MTLLSQPMEDEMALTRELDGRCVVHMTGVGNPDLGQHADVAPTRTVKVATLAEA